MPTPGDTAWSARRLSEARNRVRPTQRAYADREFSRDPRDTGSPAALADLLVQIWERRALSPAGTDTLEAMMTRCSTGSARLRAGLPEPVRLAHRTGTGGPWNDHSHAVNDVGVFTLPGGGGQVAIVVLIRDAHGSLSNTEKTIADVARAVFDAWNAPE
jgi:beta-lactamase class A